MRKAKRFNGFSESLPRFVAAGLAMAMINPAAAAELSLAWGAVPGAAGYRLHYGDTSASYARTISVGNATSYTLTGLEVGRQYCFAATAHDASGTVQSTFSNEVCATIPGTSLAPVASLDVTASSGQAPLTVTFTDTSRGDITASCWDFDVADGVGCVAGAGGGGGQAVHTYQNAGSYLAQLTVTGPGGSDSADVAITVAPPVGTDGGADGNAGDAAAGNPPPGFYRQGVDGLVVMEAEAFADNAAQPEHEWIEVSDPTGFAGDGAMLAWPDDGVRIDADYADSAPRLDFVVELAQGGTYYVWLRALATGDYNNSAHVGLDYAAVDTADRIEVAPVADWTWSNETKDNTWARLDVPAPGTYTVNVWMREAGLIIDRVLLTTDPNYVPAAEGPAATGSGQ